MYNVDVNMYGCFRNNTPSQYGEQLLALEGSVVNKGHVVQSMAVCRVSHKEVHTISKSSHLPTKPQWNFEGFSRSSAMSYSTTDKKLTIESLFKC